VCVLVVPFAFTKQSNVVGLGYLLGLKEWMLWDFSYVCCY
jgi:hypothetical protein